MFWIACCGGTMFSRAPLAAMLSAALLAQTLAPAAAANDCAPRPRSSLVVSVRDTGARGDGKSDDTAAIQRAIDKVAGKGGTVRVPGGVYMIDATSKTPLTLKSDTTLELAKDAVLRVIPNGEESYTLLTVAGASNVTVTGGALEGDRRQHQGKTGEWGMGLRVTGGTRNLALAGVTIKNMWGDGIYLAGASNVKLCGVTMDANRRQGMSVIAVDGLVVTRSVFKNTGGTRPGAGIDLEPNEATESIRNVRIENSKFIDNEGGGVVVAGKRGEVSAVAITGNVFQGREAIDIEYAPGVRSSQICANRHISYESQPGDGLSTYSEPRKTLVVQTECGDKRFFSRKKKKG